MQRPLHDERGSHNSSSDQSHRRRHARQNSPMSHGELPPTVASRERLDARDPSFGEINGRTRARDTQQAPGQMKYPGFSQGSFQPSAQYDRHHSGRDHLREHHLDAHRDESRGSSSGGERNGEKRRRRSTLPTSLSNATPWRRNDANSNEQFGAHTEEMTCSTLMFRNEHLREHLRMQTKTTALGTSPIRSMEYPVSLSRKWTSC